MCFWGRNKKISVSVDWKKVPYLELLLYQAVSAFHPYISTIKLSGTLANSESVNHWKVSVSRLTLSPPPAMQPQFSYFIAPDKALFFQLKKCQFFSYFSIKTCCGTHWKCLIEALLMSNHNMFSWRNKKNMWILLLSGAKFSLKAGLDFPCTLFWTQGGEVRPHFKEH